MVRRSRVLSLQAVKLLAAMLEDPAQERWGSWLGERIGAPSGTVYPLLRTLEQKGLLESRFEDVDPSEVGRPRRRLYRLTGQGETVARREVAQLQAALGGVRPAVGLT